MKRTVGHKTGAIFMLMPLLLLFVASKLPSGHFLHSALVLLAPACAAIGGIAWNVAVLQSGLSFGSARNYYVRRTIHRGRFYVSFAASVLLSIVWLVFMAVAAVSGLNRGAA